MLKDITIGQFFPGNSIVHRLDPRFKIILTTLFIVMIFMAKNLAAFSVGIVFILTSFFLSKISYKMMLKSLKPIIPIIIFTSVLNLFFVSGGAELVHIGFIRITEKGVYTSVFMIIRIVCLIIGTSLLTYTTSPITLTDAIERLMSPLKRIKVPVHDLSMMMTIALRFIPTLIEETDKIMQAQKARGADLETGSFLQRAKALIPILIPLFVSAFRRAGELALAMECRCYNGGDGRTRLKQLHSQGRDYIALAISIACIALVVLINNIV